MRYNESNLMDVRYRFRLGDWFSKYSLEKYGKDWDYCVGLGYKLNVKSDKYYRRKLGNLFSVMRKLDPKFDGIFVNEWDKTCRS